MHQDIRTQANLTATIAFDQSRPVLDRDAASTLHFRGRRRTFSNYTPDSGGAFELAEKVINGLEAHHSLSAGCRAPFYMHHVIDVNMIDVDTLCENRAMDSMNARLKVARTAAGFSSAMSAAKKFGWATSTYAAHENGQNEFNPSIAADYAKAFKTTAGWLLAAEGEPPSNAERRKPLIGTYDPDTSDAAERSPDERGSGVDIRASWPEDAIAELVAEGGLGTGQVIASLEVGNMKTVDEVKEEYWKFPSSFVRGTLNTTPLKMLVVECTGDSMEPTLHSGDRVWVNTGHVRPTPDGLYAIRDAFGAVIVKRLEIAQERPIRLRIISDNAKHNPREVDEHDITIVGKVVAGLRLF